MNRSPKNWRHSAGAENAGGSRGREACGVKFWEKCMMSPECSGLERIEFCNGERYFSEGCGQRQRVGHSAGERRVKDTVLNTSSLAEPQPFRPLVPTDNRVSCCGAWTAENVFEVRIIYNQTPFCDFLEFVFDGYGFRHHHQRKTGSIW
jgi:hypothetical protein